MGRIKATAPNSSYWTISQNLLIHGFSPSPLSLFDLAADNNPGVGRAIYHQEKEAGLEEEAGIGLRIDQGDEVVIYKPAPVRCRSCLAQQELLQRGQGAGGVKKLDGQTPDGGRDVQEGYPAPSPYQKTSSDHEDNEAEVRYKDQISQETVHSFLLRECLYCISLPVFASFSIKSKMLYYEKQIDKR